MLNHEKFRFFTKNLPSPDIFIDVSFAWMICACLQRRVWYYSGDLALYPNPYIVLVGPPSVGKGLILGLVNGLMKHHIYSKGIPVQTNEGPQFPPLFYAGPDSITFEKLIENMSKSIRRMITPDKAPYSHSSVYFMLEELDSLFKSKTDDVVALLKNAYDCKPYSYETKHHGSFNIRKPCLSFFAASQESFLKDAYKNKLLGTGFMSRTLFVFAKQPRLFDFHFSVFSDDQLQCKADLLNWIEELAGLYGEITYDAEATLWLDQWFLEEIKPKLLYCTNERLQEYYGRKKVTMLKLAAGLHFGETKSMVIKLETFKKAIALLDRIEPALVRSISLTGRNESHFYLLAVLEFITAATTVTIADLIKKFGVEIEIVELETILRELELGYGIRKRTADATIYYSIPTSKP